MGQPTEHPRVTVAKIEASVALLERVSANFPDTTRDAEEEVIQRFATFYAAVSKVVRESVPADSS